MEQYKHFLKSKKFATVHGFIKDVTDTYMLRKNQNFSSGCLPEYLYSVQFFVDLLG